MNNFSLLGKGGEKNDCLFALPDRPIGIGTDPDKCSIIFSQGKNGVSAFHCQLVPKQGGWTLTDYSDKGTWLNGKKITPYQAYPLKSGDVFYLASLENSFYFSADNAINPGQAQPPQLKWLEIKEKFFTWEGRLNRKPYILRGLVLGIISLIIQFVVAFILALSGSSEQAIMYVSMLASAPFYIPGFMLGIRRLHDTDHSGWWILAGWIPLVNFYVLYLLFFKKGTMGVNRFGADPLP